MAYGERITKDVEKGMKTVAIIQARMGSTRLPGKVLRNIAGRPMLMRVIDRVRGARRINEIVLATSALRGDDAIEAFCREQRVLCHRGSESDVLDRYYRAAESVQADTVVRITADCPLIEPSIIDAMLEVFVNTGKYDCVSNTIAPRTFPRGLDAEVFSISALKKAWDNDKNPVWREHVTPYIYHHTEIFRIFVHTDTIDRSTMRWTVDTPEDLEFVHRVYEAMGNKWFCWTDVLTLLQKHPELIALNSHVQQKHAV
jgi:spore coat polysaccharide biosynthesis protein SpsF